MENQIFDAQMERLKLVIRKHTATDLADFFGVTTDYLQGRD